MRCELWWEAVVCRLPTEQIPHVPHLVFPLAFPMGVFVEGKLKLSGAWHKTTVGTEEAPDLT